MPLHMPRRMSSPAMKSCVPEECLVSFTPVKGVNGVTQEGIWEAISDIADFLEQDGAVIASLARNSLQAFQAFIDYDIAGIITELSEVSADFKKIAADLRSIFGL